MGNSFSYTEKQISAEFIKFLQVVYLADSLSPLPKAVFWLKEMEFM